MELHYLVRLAQEVGAALLLAAKLFKRRIRVRPGLVRTPLLLAVLIRLAADLLVGRYSERVIRGQPVGTPPDGTGIASS